MIKYQDENGGPPGPGRYSSAAMETWCLFALPLTVATMLAAKVTLHFAESKLLATEETSVSGSIYDAASDVWSYLRDFFSREKREDIGLHAFRRRTWSTTQTG